MRTLPTSSRTLMSSASVPTETETRWNHNLQFHAWILRQMPHACESALDVGCGDGVLTTKLASRSTHATGIDISPEMIATARREAARGNITYVTGDVLSSPLPADGFDFVAVVAAIHHMPLDAALARFARLMRPGGVLAVVGLAPNASPADYAMSAASVFVSRLFRIRRGWWSSPALRIEPDMPYSQIRSIARRMLPGVVLRRRLFFRYTLLWRKP